MNLYNFLGSRHQKQFWEVVEKLISDPSVLPSMKVGGDKSLGSLIEFMTMPSQWLLGDQGLEVNQDKNLHKIELVERLMLREANLKEKGVNIKAVGESFLGSMIVANNEIFYQKLFNCATLLNDPEYNKEIANDALRKNCPLLLNLEQASESDLASIRQVMQHADTASFDVFLKSKPSASKSLVRLLGFLPKESNDLIYISDFVESKKNAPAPLDLEVLNNLTDNQNEILLRKLFDPDNIDANAYLIDMVLKTDDALNEQKASRYAHLKQMRDLYSPQCGEVGDFSILFNSALTNKNKQILVEVLEEKVADKVKTVIHDGRLSSPLHELMEMTKGRDALSERLNVPEYWCHAFNQNLNQKHRIFNSSSYDLLSLKHSASLKSMVDNETKMYDMPKGSKFLKSTSVGADRSSTPLMAACMDGNVKWARALMDAGADRHIMMDDLNAAKLLGYHALKSWRKDFYEKERSDQLSEKEGWAAYAEKMTGLMEGAGIWDIKDCAPDKYDLQLFAKVMEIHVHPAKSETPGKIAREKGIKQYIDTLSRSEFIDGLSYMLSHAGRMRETDPGLKKAVGYGISYGWVKNTPEGFEKACLEVAVKATHRELCNNAGKPVFDIKKAKSQLVNGQIEQVKPMYRSVYE